MKKMNVAAGTLILLGFLLMMGGVIQKLAGLNLLEPIFNQPISTFVVANTCFILALVIDKFDGKE